MSHVMTQYENGAEINWYSTLQSAIEAAKEIYQEHNSEEPEQFNVQLGDLAGVTLYMCEFNETSGNADNATLWMSDKLAQAMFSNPDESQVDLTLFDSAWVTDLN